MAEAGALLFEFGDHAGLIPIDAVLSEAPAARAEVTRHPVEGSSIADHIIPEPRQVDLVIAVSDSPIYRADSQAWDWIQSEVDRLKRRSNLQALASLAGPLARLVPPPDRPQPPPIPAVFEGRARATWEALVALSQSKTLVRLITGLEEFPRMTIASLATRRDAASSTSLQIQISLEEVRFVRGERSEIPERFLQADMGKQAPKPASEAQERKAREVDNRTLGATIWDTGAVLFRGGN